MPTSGGTGCLRKRAVLWILIFLGCGVNFMIRTNINIAIVAMVKRNRTTPEVNVVSECVAPPYNVSANEFVNSSTFIIPPDVADDSRFEWDEHQQNLVIGGIFWLFWASQVPAGMLSQRYGGKKVFGLANLFISLSTLLVPACAAADHRLLVALRVVQGVFAGVYRPSVNNMISKWVPPNERSKFLTACTGISVGALLTAPLCGLIIHLINWQAVFYVTGALGASWFVFWWWLVYDDPAAHPSITEKELAYIQDSLGDTISKRKLPIPWRQIVTSRPVLVNIAAGWGCLWGLYTLQLQGPTYFKVVHGWDVRMIGLVTGLPHLFRMMASFTAGFVSDYLRASGKLRVTNVRKVGTLVTHVAQAAFLLGLACAGCDAVAAAACLALGLAASGADNGGYIAAFIDLSPNFCGILVGICNVICVTPGFLSPAVVGFLTYQNQTSEQWRKVFLIASAAVFSTGVLHLVASSADVQPWNWSLMEDEHRASGDVADSEVVKQPLTGDHDQDPGANHKRSQCCHS